MWHHDDSTVRKVLANLVSSTVYTGSTSVILNGTSFERAALTGDVTAAQDSNATTITNNAVTSAKILDGTIATADLANNAVTVAKLPAGATATTFLRGDGTWVTPTDSEPWYVATTSTKATSNTQNIYQNGRVGIGNFSATTPATALDIENGTTNGAIKIVDGTQGAGKILISDANGVGTWRTTGVATKGTIPSANGTLTTTTSYTGYNISVPPGNSVVSCGFLLINAASGDGYATFHLTTSSSTNTATGITSTPGLSAINIVPLVTGTNVGSSGQILFNVNNTTSANITVYVWGALASANLTTVIIGGSGAYGEPFIFVQQ